MSDIEQIRKITFEFAKHLKRHQLAVPSGFNMEHEGHNLESMLSLTNTILHILTDGKWSILYISAISQNLTEYVIGVELRKFKSKPSKKHVVHEKFLFEDIPENFPQ
jgi:hypothetical protein